MTKPTSTDTAISNGIAYLQVRQLPTGGFASCSSADPQRFSEAVSYQTIFSTTLILQNLSFLPETEQLQSLKAKTIKFLLHQKSPRGSWNYWDRQSRESKTFPYPDDLDDSFCALTALQLAEPSLITGAVLADATHLLTALETAEGGPYKTWLVGPEMSEAWHDVDLGVNLNIGYFLHLNGVELPNLTHFFNSAFTTEQITTPYYPLQLPILFFASRFLHKPMQRKYLLRLVLKIKPQNSLETALQLLILLNLNHKPHSVFELKDKLIAKQLSNGSWPAATFYTGVNPDQTKKFLAGSTALTTSFVLCALHKVVELEKPKQQNSTRVKTKLKAKILKKVARRFANLSPEIQQIAKQYLKQVERNDQGGQITLLPWLFCQAIGNRVTAISEETLAALGAASVYGWVAYTIYDDFLDAEAKIVTLPLANICLRELTVIFTQFHPEDAEFQKLFQRVLDQQEAANAWEVTHCRFNSALGWNAAKTPDFGDLAMLAHRSLGHCLGCAAISLKLQYHPESQMVKNLEQFFQHYLIARQLNDDAHDWEADLARGQINAVGARLIVVSPSDRKKLFWTETIDWVCDTMRQHLTLAEAALQNMSELQKPEILRALLTSQVRALTRVQAEREKAQEFLENY